MKFAVFALISSETLAVSLNKFVESSEIFDRQFDEPQVNHFDGYIHLANGKLLDGKTYNEVQDDDMNVMTSFLNTIDEDLDHEEY
jgi:hypothetical protein